MILRGWNKSNTEIGTLFLALGEDLGGETVCEWMFL